MTTTKKPQTERVRVEGGEMGEVVRSIDVCVRDVQSDSFLCETLERSKDLLTRLSAAKAEAERERDEARAELAQAREALEFYAAPESYRRDVDPDSGCLESQPVIADDGDIARRALTPTQESETP